MGCKCSKLNPEICLKDEAAWLEKMRQQCHALSQTPRTNNYNVGLFNVDSTSNSMTTNENPCSCSWNWHSELPVIILLAVVVLFVVYFWRKYREHKWRRAFRDAVVGYSANDRARPCTVNMFQHPQGKGNKAIDYSTFDA